MKQLLLLFLFVPFLSFSQKVNSTEAGGQSNLYNDAIKRYLLYQSKTNQRKLETLTVQEGGSVTDSLLTVIGKTRINVVEWQGVLSLVDKEGSIVLYKLFPLSYDKGKFFISIVPYLTSKSNDGINLEYSGGCKVVYTFDSQTMEFKFVKVDCHGI